MAERLALVVNALTGEELTGGRLDARRIFTLLCDEELGACSAHGPAPIEDCASRQDFETELLKLIADWDLQNQLILYFSGHGVIKNNAYTLAFGESPNQSFLPFANIMSDLQTHGVTRAIVILDACQSGVVVKGQKKVEPLEPPSLFSEKLPQGMAVLTSCRETESAWEFSDGSGSVFTHLFSKGIRSGLDGRTTDDGMIGPADITEYINEQLAKPEYAAYPQSSVYRIDHADSEVWLAYNRTSKEEDTGADEPPLGSARSLDELRFLYEMTEASRRPCPGPTSAELDLELMRKFAESSGVETDAAPETLARRLELYSPVAAKHLHRAAVLCFATRPELHIHQARAIFVSGNPSSRLFKRTDVTGPLSAQVSELYGLVESALRREQGSYQQTPAQDQCLQAVREAISNAITHRDYESPQVVKVTVDYPRITVQSPGRLPSGRSFETLLKSQHVSTPQDAAITLYLTRLLAFEGIGRGFSVFSEFIRETDASHLLGSELEAEGFVVVEIHFPDRDLSAGSDALAPEPSATLKADAPSPPPATAPPAPTASTLPFDRVQNYTLQHPIGSGSGGSVFLARDEKLGRDVVVKVISRRFEQRDTLQRFEREARILAQLSHPNIVPVHDVGVLDDYLYIVMTYMPGGSLKARIEQERTRERRDSLPWKIKATAQIAYALEHAHQGGIIHRDIKPSNLLLDSHENVMLADFGIARDQQALEEQTTILNVSIGTPAYMSPEQLGGDASLDGKTDVYSLGVVLCELLTGERPSPGHFDEGPRRFNPQIPAELDKLCRHSLARDKASRPSAGELAQALEQLSGSKARPSLLARLGNFFRGS